MQNLETRLSVQICLFVAWLPILLAMKKKWLSSMYGNTDGEEKQQICKPLALPGPKAD